MEQCLLDMPQVEGLEEEDSADRFEGNAFWLLFNAVIVTPSQLTGKADLILSKLDSSTDNLI